ncbi:DUF397 domain-containing protein [Streptomyces sp. NBC_00893]|uniref:DUF397 domain-containing protein n=1 Tax=Streptomyces sp. NBC_00893 TaxID=2975862 RepID=UPI00224F74DC|nr:DUF397 domain-containing protein [Streptomyces sp. NBC_00893]MCX4847706.1 DUF397 domain-containing protein [Streptomyces sp. NBC_00893]
MTTGPELSWFKSSYSNNEGGACIEVATRPHTVHVRDSKVTDGPTFVVAPAAWTAFLADAVAGRP